MLKILKMNMTEGVHFFIVSGEQIYFTLLSTIHLDIEGRHFLIVILIITVCTLHAHNCISGVRLACFLCEISKTMTIIL